MTNLTHYEPAIGKVQQAALRTLVNRGLPAPFKSWRLTQSQAGHVWLFGELDVTQLPQIERYCHSELLHQMSTLAAGRPMFISNSTGLRYACLMSGKPRLRRTYPLPAKAPEQVALGYSLLGPVKFSWRKLGHTMIAGKSGSGKSNLLQAIVLQAIQDGMQVVISDIEQTTFPMLTGHPQVTLAGDAEETLTLIQALEREMDERRQAYAALAPKSGVGYVEDLDDFNAHAPRFGIRALPRMLVVIDEYNSLVAQTGGLNKPFAKRTQQLANLGRKWGIHLLLAGQTFHASKVGEIRDQMQTRVCLWVENANTSNYVVGHRRAAKLTANTPGRGYVKGVNALVQCYRMEKHLLLDVMANIARPTVLTVEQLALIDIFMADDMRVRYQALVPHGYSERQAKAIVTDFDQRGWAQKERQLNNARYLTETVLALYQQEQGQ